MKSTLIVPFLLYFSFNLLAQNEMQIHKPIKVPTYYHVIETANVYTDTLITIRLSKAKLDYLLENQIDLSSTASDLLANYFVNTPDSLRPSIVSKKILEDGGFETIYDDRSRRIQYKDGFVFVSPLGEEMKALYSQTPTFAPPADPSDPGMAQYLQNVHNELTNFILQLLDNDEESMLNFEKGDSGLSIYQKINRRFDLISYLISM